MRNQLLFSMLFVLLGAANSVFAQCASPANIYTFIYDGKTYEVVRENQNWAAAAACAVQRGGHLVEINDQAEQNAVYAEIQNASINPSNTTAQDGGGAAYVWMGANDIVTEGAWIWDGDGDGMNTVAFWQGNNGGMSVGGLYHNWGTNGGVQNEPDNFPFAATGQDGGAIALESWPFGAPPTAALGFAGQWNDVDHQNALYYVIEYPVDCSSSSTIDPNSCGDYTSPSGNYTWSTSGTYMDTIPNTAGCDSVMTINLTVTTVDTSITKSGTTLTVGQTNATTYRWINCADNSTIAGATSASYTATESGDYACEITVDNCMETTSCVTVTTVGVEDVHNLTNIKVYPNPSQGVFSVQMTEVNVPVTVMVTDLSGRLVFERVGSSTDFKNVELDVNSGAYVVSVSYDAVVKTFSLIVE